MGNNQRRPATEQYPIDENQREMRRKEREKFGCATNADPIFDGHKWTLNMKYARNVESPELIE